MTRTQQAAAGQVTATSHSTSSTYSTSLGRANDLANDLGGSAVAVVEDLGRRAAVGSSSARARRAPQPRDGGQSESAGYLGQVETKVDGNKLVTTVGTVAAQSSQSRIVVALLKDGQHLQLKIQEMRPGIFEVGSNHQECLKYCEEHRKLVVNLHKHKQAPLDGWLSKYQKIRLGEPNMSAERKIVFTCMAENLQACWRSLLSQLELRTKLLDEACAFFQSADQLVQALDAADNHVQLFRQDFLDGPGSNRFKQSFDELKRLNQTVLERYNAARDRQQQVIHLIGLLATGNLGDARVNHLISDAQNLINYISTYIDPLERRKIQLESVITTSRTTTTTTSTTTTSKRTAINGSDRQTKQYIQEQEASRYSAKAGGGSKGVLREMSSFNELTLVENWLELKVEQLNSSLLSSLGVSATDSRSILAKHEQIALECSAIEEASLKFNGKNIHAIKSVEPKDDKTQGDKSLFEQQKSLATTARDVITILDARIVLLRRTIDFYAKSKDATTDIAKMMRRLQVDNSLQSVQYVSNELELKDVSSVIASGATIVSELQQLQLAQKHGQRSNIVNLNLITKGIRAIIDQLSQDLSHLKTVLNQRRLVLLNEDAAKMANNFSNKCQQLQFWLNNHAKSYLLANNQFDPDPRQVRALCDGHDQLRVAVQNKTLEVEALLRLLSTLTESFDAKSQTADEIQQDTDELRKDWINVTNCLDRRTDVAKNYLNILNMVAMLNRELDSLQGGPKTEEERTDEDIRSNIEQKLAQLTNQVRNFSDNLQKMDTAMSYSPTLDAKPVVNDINKQQLIDHANSLVAQFLDKRHSSFATGGRKRHNESRSSSTSSTSAKTTERAASNQQVTAPRMIRSLEDKEAEPFSSVELECETVPSGGDCKVEWLMNSKRIPSNIRHQASSANNRHKLVISNFNPVCCGLYTIRISNSLGVATSQCRLRLAGIKEVQDEQGESVGAKKLGQVESAAQRSGPKPAPGMERIIMGVESTVQWPRQSRQPSSTGRKLSSLTTSVSEAESPGLPVTASTYTCPSPSRATGSSSAASTIASSQLHPNYLVESPGSGAASSASRSPLEGTPQAPVFAQGLTDSLRHCCSRAGLVCLVVANPPPTIEWLHNDKTIATARCPRPAAGATCQRGNICKLTIETVNKRTQGNYVCRASNRLGQSSTALTLTK